MFLKNKNIIFKTRRSKVTDYAALNQIHQGVIPTVNPDVLIFVKNIVVFVFIHQDNHFIQKYLTKQCCLLIMSAVHFKIFSSIISSCKQTL